MYRHRKWVYRVIERMCREKRADVGKKNPIFYANSCEKQVPEDEIFMTELEVYLKNAERHEIH